MKLEFREPATARHSQAPLSRWVLRALAYGLCLALFANGGHADEEELAYELFILFPERYDNSELVHVVEETFTKRGWNLTSVTEDTVVARIQYKDVDATMALKAQNDRLLYHVVGTKTKVQTKYKRQKAQKVTRTEEDYVPEEWVEHIRMDIVRTFENGTAETETIPQSAEGSKPAPSDSESAAERLRTLENLRSEGLVSQEEYDAKRSEILSDL